MQNGDGKLSGALAAQPGMKQTTYLAIRTAQTSTASQSGPSVCFATIHPRAIGRINGGPEGKDWVEGDIAYTMDTQPQAQAVAIRTAQTPLVMAHGQGGAEIREGQAPCLACNHEAPILFEHHMQDSRIKGQLDVSPQLNAKAGTGGGNLPLVLEAKTQYGPLAGTFTARHDSSPCADRGANVVAFNWQSGGDCRLEPREEQANTLQRCQTQAVAMKSIARRLTPTECERLQGFPYSWTRIPYRGKPAENCPDGPRYKALGNSWAVPCARWIFERIDNVDLL